jgi:hypothetical protein
MSQMSLRKSLLAVTLVSVSVGLLACSKPPTPGASCKTRGDIQCIDKKTGAVCVDGKWEAMTCEGPTGCMSVAGAGSCTHTKYAVGEACLQEGKPECSGDRKSMMKCVGSHWQLVNTCAGALGCVSNANGTRCDLGAATEGSPCTKENEGNASCTPDAKSLLLCKGGTMTIGARCKGMHGCRQLGNKLDCDETIGELGDVCDSSEYEGKFACSTDKKMRLVCKNNKFVKDKACKCSVMIDKVNCG